MLANTKVSSFISDIDKLCPATRPPKESSPNRSRLISDAPAIFKAPVQCVNLWRLLPELGRYTTCPRRCRPRKKGTAAAGQQGCLRYPPMGSTIAVQSYHRTAWLIGWSHMKDFWSRRALGREFPSRRDQISVPETLGAPENFVATFSGTGRPSQRASGARRNFQQFCHCTVTPVVHMFSSHKPVPIKGMGLLRRHKGRHRGTERARGFMSGRVPLG
jgi:hypothetical protein